MEGQGAQTPPGKSQGAIGFRRNTGMNPPLKGPIASGGRFVWPSVLMTKKCCQDPLMESSGSPHALYSSKIGLSSK